MKRTLLSVAAALMIGTSLTGCVDGNLNTTSLSALQDAARAATLSESDAKAMAAQAAVQMDQQNDVMPASSRYTKRLNRLVRKFRNEDGLALNFKVYDSPQINAFAMSDGTIRVYRGLLDTFSDDEVRFVIGHEIGHVKLGHSLKAMRTAYATSAVRKGVASQGGRAAQLSSSQLGALGEALVNAQFSQSQERDSDTYAVSFMKKHGFDPRAGLSVMKKFQQMDGGKGSMLSSHPASTEREDHIARLL
ncbi:M48 family metalloprotease [Marinobacterium weihaiense]|uniref:M48 family metalloprotease n=1 Tax=Marinobacterium weihaiense TaxID=2851016 RepID=A0ABS6MFE4_9GAMM|nr:M48 family metalloprotease [Marinobacterium weihaiense]MBV0934511.1 M48 family metalloprotease [Marinobacterium weihaiense]